VCKVRGQRCNAVKKEKIFLLGLLDVVFKLLNFLDALSPSFGLLVVKTVPHDGWFGFLGFWNRYLVLWKGRIAQVSIDGNELDVAEVILHRFDFLGQN
jgi:hypothetical protein